MLNHYDYFSENIGNLDYLYTPYHNFEGVRGFNVSFDYAYAKRLGRTEENPIAFDRFDSLRLLVETVCGDGEPKVLWQPTEQELLTVSQPLAEPFIPTQESEWKKAELFLEKGNNDEFARFFFEAESFNGNNLYIDNFSITPDYSVETPTNFRNSRTENEEITLRWINPSPNALGFKLERSVDGSPFEEIATINAGEFLYKDTDTATGEEYTYRMYSFSKFDNRSEYTDEVTVALRVTGLDYYAIQGLNLYPNPSQGLVQLSINNSERGEVNASVYSIDGKLLQSITGQKSGNGFEQALNLDSYGAGIYFVRIALGNQITVRKVIIE